MNAYYKLNKFIDTEMLPADLLCLSGISADYDVTRRFLVCLGQRYKNVLYVYGGCDLKSDMPLDLKFEKIKDSLRSFQRRRCTPERLDGTLKEIDKLVVGGASGIDRSVNISKIKWWSDNFDEIYDDEVNRIEKCVNCNPNIMLTYVDPLGIGKKNFGNISIWNYGSGKNKSILQINDTLLINNSHLDKSKKFSKQDFLIKL